MADQPNPTPSPTPSPAPAAPDYQFPLQFYAQLTHPVRIWILRQLAQGKELTPKQVATAWKRKPRAINLHCQSLHEAGLISWRPNEDRRSDLYFLPEQFRREPGWLDYGFCRFRI
jgi:DNA-binding MarR family transcriptional regulator